MSEVFVDESPIEWWIEGMDRPFVLTVSNATSITGTPAIKVYHEESDTGTDYLSAATGSTDGTKKITTGNVRNLVGGETYVLNITATVNGVTEPFPCIIKCRHPWGRF